MKIVSTLIVVFAVLLVFSCKREKLESFPEITSVSKTVSTETVNLSQVVKENDILKIPIKISLSGSATKAFQVGLELDNDTLYRLIANKSLDPNVVVLSPGAVQYSPVINVAYGADSSTAILSIKGAALEANYGKKVATAFRLTNIEKGNTINNLKSSFIVVINTLDVVKYNEIHYVTIAKNGGSQLILQQGQNYTSNSGGINIPIGIALAGQAGSTFTVKAISNADTINNLINNHLLPENTVLLPADKYQLDSLIVFGSYKNSADFSVNIPWSVFDANISANKTFAFAIQLKDPSFHVLHAQNSMVIIIIKPSVNLDNNSYILGNGTGLKGEYFKNNQFLDFDGRLPDMTRLDPNIDFDWGGGNPFNTNNDDNYSCRWKGKFLAPVSGEYIFYQTRWDDGSRLFVNGQTIIDDFTARWDLPTRVGKITLERGKKYAIELNHRENVGGSNAHFEFEVPSAGITGKRIVPGSQFYPE